MGAQEAGDVLRHRGAVLYGISDFVGAFSSVGRAPALQAGGRRFESDMVHPMSSLTWWEKKNGCGSSSVGRASPFQGEGRGFEPRLPLKNCIYIYQ